MFNHLPAWLEFLEQHRYTLLFLMGMTEGGATSVLTGVLVATGHLAAVTSFLVLTASETLHGFLWFLAGRRWGTRVVNWFVGGSAMKRTVVDTLAGHFDRFSAPIILIAKMTFSLTNVTLALSGALGYERRRFHLYNLVGSVGWVAMLMGVGYFFGAKSTVMLRYLQGASFWVGIVMVTLAAIGILTFASRSVLDRFVDRVYRSNGKT